MEVISDRSGMQALLAQCQVGMPTRDQPGHIDEGGRWTAIHLDPVTRRTPQHEHDWGDNATVGAFVVHRGSDGKLNGRYLGPAGASFLVGVIEHDRNTPVRLERFDTVSEMKARWVLD